MATWTTKDGRILDMAEMSDAHLANAVGMVKVSLIRRLRLCEALEAEQTRRQAMAPRERWRVVYRTPAFTLWRHTSGRELRFTVFNGEHALLWTDPENHTVLGDFRGRLDPRAAMVIDAACFPPARA
jgi:hypothetical protein